MSIRNLMFGVNSVTVSYLITYDSFLQNATGFFITKSDSSSPARGLSEICHGENL